MTDAAAELAAALRTRLEIIGDRGSRDQPEQHIARLKEVSERIELLRERLPRPLDPQLAHYLQRASYDKALELLDATASTIRPPTAR